VSHARFGTGAVLGEREGKLVILFADGRERVIAATAIESIEDGTRQ